MERACILRVFEVVLRLPNPLLRFSSAVLCVLIGIIGVGLLASPPRYATWNGGRKNAKEVANLANLVTIGWVVESDDNLGNYTLKQKRRSANLTSLLNNYKYIVRRRRIAL